MRFDVCARAYDLHARPQRAFAARVAAFARIPPGQTVLELGAGTGALTHALSQIPGIRIYATDASPAMLSIGRTAAPNAHWSLLDAFVGPIPASSFQLSSGLLQWAKDPLRVLQLWANSLNPGGRMVHAFPCEPCLQEWRGVVPESPLVWRDESDWLGLFAAARLSVLQHARWIEQHVFPSALEMLRGLHESGVTGRARLTPGRLRQGIRAYDRQHRNSSGVVATWAWMSVEAQPA